MLGRYERERAINRVIIENNITEGYSLDDWDDGCFNHGVWRNYTCYWYSEYTGDNCEKVLDDFEDGVKYYVVAGIWAVIVLAGIGANWALSGWGEDVKPVDED